MKKPDRPTKSYKPRGIFKTVADKPRGRLPSLLEFLNPLSLPPGETDAGKVGPTWGDVVTPPPSEPQSRPPGLLEFLNPFSEPPGQTPQATPIGYDNPMGGPQSYWNTPQSNPLPPAQMPPGWQPPPSQGEIARRLLELQQQRHQENEPPPVSYHYAPTFRRINPAPRRSWRDIVT